MIRGNPPEGDLNLLCRTLLSWALVPESQSMSPPCGRGTICCLYYSEAFMSCLSCVVFPSNVLGQRNVLDSFFCMTHFYREMQTSRHQRYVCLRLITLGEIHHEMRRTSLSEMGIIWMWSFSPDSEGTIVIKTVHQGQVNTRVVLAWCCSSMPL